MHLVHSEEQYFFGLIIIIIAAKLHTIILINLITHLFLKCIRIQVKYMSHKKKVQGVKIRFIDTVLKLSGKVQRP